MSNQLPDSNRKLTFEKVKTNSVYTRKNLVTIENMARPKNDQAPSWNYPKEFETLVDRIINARLTGKPVIWSMGAHVIKNGLSRYIIEMVRAGIVTHVAGNGASSIHDFELAFLGETSEDVATAIEDGSFGMWEETGRYMNEAIQQGENQGLGYGESLSEYVRAHLHMFPYVEDCVFVQTKKAGVPYTCHISIGTDIIHQHPIVNFATLGSASGRDFSTFCDSFSQLGNGGVFLNFGSAISGPEIFLKAWTICKNSGFPMEGITAANFDITSLKMGETYDCSNALYYYRPRRNMIERLSKCGGEGFHFQGLHQQTIPTLYHLLLKKWNKVTQEQAINLTITNKNTSPLTLLNESREMIHVECLPIKYKNNQMTIKQLLVPETIGDYKLNSLSHEWNSPLFEEFAEKIWIAKKNSFPIVFSMGGNVISNGLSKYIIELMKEGYITHIAGNGCSSMQDFELAAVGGTEEVEESTLQSGYLGMWEETGAWMLEAIETGYAKGLGYGESIAVYAEQNPQRFPYLETAIFHHAAKLNIPYTCHITLGTDTIHMHPKTNFKVLGGASGIDFQIFCKTVAHLDGGVFMNFGSTVTGPEVFLKALSIGRNLDYTISKITTANFDIIQLGDYHRKVGYEDQDYYYRPRKNIVHRPTSLGGKGYHFEGLHQQTIPPLYEYLKCKEMEERR
ncbi:GSU2086 family protein [Neobacillus ginsengisoli]|uniref:Deoxyhypusine synthase n=1 Tax=Neobacillus ginsengisoli TaxID=904295 RepID=A0ABT9XYF1_9BACI|nr:hypothetical protein [Neobacillus ginsengisoli]MDQ0200295.1 hypothetical protein [Neobacillus ginsengisoli]